MNFIKKYRGATLLILNLILLVIIIFGQNALNLFKTGYTGADSIVDLSEKNIASIKIIDPDNHGSIIELVRTPKKRTSKLDENKKPQKLIPEFIWKTILNNPSLQNNSTEFLADNERLKDFLEGIENTRDYYSVTRTSKRDVELEMGSDSIGKYKGLQIIIQKADSPKKFTLYVGKTNARGSQSYVRLNNEDKIYLVETNLRSITGSGELNYFRDRNIFSDQLNVDNITMIEAVYSLKNRKVQLSKQTKDWFITAPIQKAADSNAVSSFLRDITSWKATDFYDSLPAEHDPTSQLNLTIYYNQTGNITDQLNQNLIVYSKKENSSNYYIQLEDQKNWIQINSIYLEDLKSPLAKFSKRASIELPSNTGDMLQ